MDDDELFRREMADLGVRPLGAEASGEAGAGRDESVRRLRRALRDKTEPSSPSAPRERPRRRPPSSPPPQVDGRLDLHGADVEEALRRLAAFVRSEHRRGSRRLLIITGRGRRSPGGQAVLRPAVAGWLDGPGRQIVADWRPAPPSLGGEGALLVDIG